MKNGDYHWEFLQYRPYIIYGRYLQSIGSWNGHWSKNIHDFPIFSCASGRQRHLSSLVECSQHSQGRVWDGMGKCVPKNGYVVLHDFRRETWMNDLVLPTSSDLVIFRCPIVHSWFSPPILRHGWLENFHVIEETVWTIWRWREMRIFRWIVRWYLDIMI